MDLTITSLRVDYRVTPQGNMWIEDVPYAIINLCFKIDKTTADGEGLWIRTKAEAEEYQSVLTIDDPEKYEKFILNWALNCSSTYDGYGRAWTHNEGPWQYIEKFDTFWYREWVADSFVTRMIFQELKYYKENGKLPSVYRHTEECIILQHLRALHGYWD